MTKYYLFKYTLLISVIFSLAACADKQCVLDAGEYTSFDLGVDEFKSVKFFGMFDVYIHSDTNKRIILEGREKLLENIDTAWELGIANNRIRIGNNNFCDFIRKYERPEAHIYTNDLRALVTQGACKVVSVDTIKSPSLVVVAISEINEMDLSIQANYFHFYNNGDVGGEYIFRGKVNNARIRAYANARLVVNMLADSIQVEQNSVLDYYIITNKQINVSISNSGDVIYSGNPHVVINSVTGSGQLINRP